MALMNLIEYMDQAGNEMCHRIPEQGSGEFKLGSQLIVRENQWAVFYRDGKALDVFGAGRHRAISSPSQRPGLQQPVSQGPLVALPRCDP